MEAFDDRDYLYYRVNGRGNRLFLVIFYRLRAAAAYVYMKGRNSSEID